MPDNSKSTLAGDSFPTRSVRIDLSSATISETFATESLGRCVARAVSRTLPGASAHRKLLVNGTQTAVVQARSWSGADGPEVELGDALPCHLDQANLDAV